MNFSEIITQLLLKTQTFSKIDEMLTKSLVTTVSDLKKGDYSVPCFLISKTLGIAPNEVASGLASEVNELFSENADLKQSFEKVEAVGGYVNFFLNKENLCANVSKDILGNKENYFKEDLGKGQIVTIDFSSVNLAKHFHIGHMRNTILGSAISNMLEAFGYKVFKHNYLGDFGIQFGEIIATAEHLKKDIFKSNVNELQTIYAESKILCEENAEIKAKAKEWFVKIINKEKTAIELYNSIKETTLKETQTIFDEFGITFDSYNGEFYYQQFTAKYLKELEQKKISKVSEGATIVDLTDYGLKTAVLKTSEGYTVYASRDIAAAVEREKEYNFDKLLIITATEQILHFQEVFKIVEMLGYETYKKLKHIYYGRYSLEDGKLSSRYGAKALLKDILAEAKTRAKTTIIEKGKASDAEIESLSSKIGKGALIYSALSTTRAKDIVFNLDRTLAFDGETGPYLQYVLARINSLFAKAKEQNISADIEFDKTTMTEEDFKIYRLLYQFKDVCITAIKEYEPSFIAKYLIDIAKAFNQFYTINKIMTENLVLTKSRLTTCKCVMEALKFGFELLGIPVVEKM